MQTPSPIDMFTPAQTCAQLEIDEPALVCLVNDGQLAAYNFGGTLRFKVLDVLTRSAQLAAA